MGSYRFQILLAVLAVTTVFVVWSLWPDGTISVDFRDAPLSKVIAAIERQGRVDIVTNVPPETPVMLQLRRAPLLEALETLSVRIDADLRPAVIAAPAKARTREALANFETGNRSEDWVVHWMPGGGMFGPVVPIDARKLDVVFEKTESPDLQSSLQQVSAKSGLLTAIPKDWNPEIANPPARGEAASLARSLAKAGKGESAEVFLMLTRPRDRGERTGPPATAGASRDQGGGGPGGGGFWQRPDRANVNPAWLQARAQAVIAQLPAEERPKAQAELDEMQNLLRETSQLSEEERRAKMQEFFSRPEVQERLAEREAARDARRTPEQRSERYKRYNDRKQQARQES